MRCNCLVNNKTVSKRWKVSRVTLNGAIWPFLTLSFIDLTTRPRSLPQHALVCLPSRSTQTMACSGCCEYAVASPGNVLSHSGCQRQTGFRVKRNWVEEKLWRTGKEWWMQTMVAKALSCWASMARNSPFPMTHQNGLYAAPSLPSSSKMETQKYLSFFYWWEKKTKSSTRWITSDDGDIPQLNNVQLKRAEKKNPITLGDDIHLEKHCYNKML